MDRASKQAMQYQMELNRQLAQEDRAWQERMSNSAHQREISDLKKAGLNPVLSVTGGQGSSTPSGSSASVGDGSGYFSAMANLEAARINSATQKYVADSNFNIQKYVHDNPSANTISGQLENAPETIFNVIKKIGKFDSPIGKALMSFPAIRKSVDYIGKQSKSAFKNYKTSKAESKYNQEFELAEYQVELATLQLQEVVGKLSGKERRRMKQLERKIRRRS